MSPSILLLCLLAGTSWAFVPDDPGFRGTDSFGGYPHDIFYFTRNAFAASSSDTAQQVVEKFLVRTARSLESNNVAEVSGLFQDGFVFKGCKGTYDKSQIIDLLSQIPRGTEFTITLKSVLDTGSSIKYTVVASGFGPSSIEANFVLNKIDQQLEYGEIPACQKNSSSGIQNNTQISAVEMAKNFRDHAIISIKSQDVAKITDLFDVRFLFKGCLGAYNYGHAVQKLTSIPAGTRFSFTFKSVSEHVHSVEFTVVVTGINESPFEAKFVLSKYDQRLEYGQMLGCPTGGSQKALVGRSQPEDSNAVVQRFLSSMKETIDSHEPALIGKLFDNAFIFKGCHGTYTKAQSIAKITAFPSGAFLDFSLIESKWNNQGQIEYTASVSVPRMDSFKAQFVYCPHRNVLKSGSIPGCAARRFSVFY
ncbi:unnamed protein product [Caenorhabditis nigoni]